MKFSPPAQLNSQVDMKMKNYPRSPHQVWHVKLLSINSNHLLKPNANCPGFKNTLICWQLWMLWQCKVIFIYSIRYQNLLWLNTWNYSYLPEKECKMYIGSLTGRIPATSVKTIDSVLKEWLHFCFRSKARLRLDGDVTIAVKHQVKYLNVVCLFKGSVTVWLYGMFISLFEIILLG